MTEFRTQPLRVVSFRNGVADPIGPGTIDPVADRSENDEGAICWTVRWDDGTVTTETNQDLRVIGEEQS